MSHPFKRRSHALRSASIAACLLAASFTQANDALKAQTIQRSPGVPSAAITKQSPSQAPLDVQQATAVLPQTRTSSIQLLNQSAITAGEAVNLRVYGMTSARGTAVLKVHSANPNVTTELPIRITDWNESANIVSGIVGASRGVGDGHAKVIITLPNGSTIVSGMQSATAVRTGVGANDMRFVASRATTTLPASVGNPQVMTSNYASPAPQILTQGNLLLNGWAVSRRQHKPMRDTEFGGCDGLAVPSDRFQLKLASGFELVEVKMRDLNKPRFDGSAPSRKDSCDHRHTANAPTPPVRSAKDGSFVIQSTWDMVDRYGSKTKSMKCSSTRAINATKSPLGFDWDNFGPDRCGFNAEYVVDAFVFRGPAGLNPLFGTPDSGATIK
jgi:hypothetical protein